MNYTSRWLVKTVLIIFVATALIAGCQKDNHESLLGTFYEPSTGRIIAEFYEDSSGIYMQQFFPAKIEFRIPMHPITTVKGNMKEGQFSEMMHELLGSNWKEGFQSGLINKEEKIYLLKVKKGFQSDQQIYTTGYMYWDRNRYGGRLTFFRTNVEKLE